MSRKDTSLHNIDIAKLVGYIFIFLIVCLLLIFAFILPNIKQYRAVSQINNSAFASYSKAKYILDGKNAELNALKEENSFILQAYEHKFNKEHFIKFASKFFSNVSLEEIKDTSKSQASNKEQKYFSYELSITSASDTPKKLYAFLDALSKYDNIIKVEFPIQMKSDSDNNIITKFNIKVYSNKDNN